MLSIQKKSGRGLDYRKKSLNIERENPKLTHMRGNGTNVTYMVFPSWTWFWVF
jgi:hypothetical protein